MHALSPLRRISVILTFVALAAGCSDATAPNTTASAEEPAAISSTTVAAPVAASAGYRSVSYDDPAHWICRPEAPGICGSDLDATVVAADGTLTVEPFHADPDAPIDCFYVYPTISRDQSKVSDWNASPDEEGYAVLNQAARLGSVCRVFAPVYRQTTLTALASALSGATGPAGDGTVQPYDDVLDAWKTYMAEDNHGRGVVLIGHSQGSGMLSRLITEEIDPRPEVRAKLVSAYLAGWTVKVPDGADVGGDFKDVPVCRAEDQVGCVVTWASFRSTAPPPAGAYFGKPRTGEGVAGCANPATLGGGSAELHNYFPANRKASILSALGATGDAASTWVDASAGAVSTPFVSLPGLVTGECVNAGGRNYLAVTVHADPGPRADDIPGDLTPEWGLHLVDVSLVMGDVVDLVRSQSAAWAKRP